MDLLDFPDAGGWQSWLDAHHTVRADAWLRITRRHAPNPGITIAEALDAALCYGWIDGQRKSHDDVSFLQRYRDAGQCCGLQVGGEGSRWEGRRVRAVS